MTSALRGKGVPSKADILSNLSKGGCRNLQTRGEGVKKFQNISDVIYGNPLRRPRKADEVLHFKHYNVPGGSVNFTLPASSHFRKVR